MKQSTTFYRNQFIMCIAAIPLGAVTGAICAVFGLTLLKITDYRTNHYLYLLPFLGVAGVFITWCYNRFGSDSAKGMALLFEIHQDKRSSIPLRLIPFAVGSTWLTHLFGGSAGREGVATQIGGTLGSYIGNKIRVSGANKILMISGMAAGFSGLFHTPLAAVFFALEVLHCGVIEYSALLPSFVSAYTASCISEILGLQKSTYFLDCRIVPSFSFIMKIIVLGVLFGLTGMLFSILLKKLRALLTNYIKNNIIRIFVFGTIIGIISIICFQGRYSGPGTNLISACFSNDIMPWDFMLKILFTALTLAAGYYGGEVVPLFSIGASAGFVLANVLELPVELCVALGYVAVFGSATNTFFAPLFISTEIFGTEYLPVFAAVCAIAYMFNGNNSIYPLQIPHEAISKVLPLSEKNFAGKKIFKILNHQYKDRKVYH
ncbi:H+/Cl- antiporter ClcA [Acetivibrio thermocellus AD2]|uniref:H+/Cl-antiporter ClcA n=1 Tax=Acetivibrio thermocellus AD2 TaxID=1138384 RepID=A0AB36TL86_ACETH|nr:chloride channel protein [Acetivibrio thermocellus]ADU75824.1 Cl- channel voltage-gated family protein [Acetivibrio thermocellus DSM 1313]ALX09856.1 Cl- channel voltage-gated family protein [Acetivibrio thermocellus AD2]ANV77630.1 Cl- channel voltage-gated family protein [Acetivibrio thermocellus DSM 2360]EIC03629.1 Cl- channel voltage-gated family protein [Acetivibrio thermocellus YS]NLU26939.1 voltage-gated chloride channel protein [Acetivibrio thermocellus]